MQLQLNWVSYVEMKRLFRQHFYLVGRWTVRNIIGYVFFDVDSFVEHFAGWPLHVANDAVEEFGARWCGGLTGTTTDRGRKQW